MDVIRIGIIGIGGMGSNYARQIIANEIPGVVLSAVCDTDESRFADFPDAHPFTKHRMMLESGTIDAVIIATPHLFHRPVSMDAIKAGIHLLVDKPLGVHKHDCQDVIDAYEARERDDLIFGIMFNQRTRPIYRKLKFLIDSGELGTIRRINWVVTDWFRPEAYYRSGGWRATWKGEGGGVLLNQSIHQIDLIQWLFGLPSRVRAFGALGKYHNIEVEDEVTAYMDFLDGSSAVFITSTGEAPGTNRLEIAADRGRVVVENDRIDWIRNEVGCDEYSATTADKFGMPPTWNIEVRIEEKIIPEHTMVIRRFANALRGIDELVAHGSEGIRSVELVNAMLFSLINETNVNLPIDGGLYEAMLNRLIGESQLKSGMDEI